MHEATVLSSYFSNRSRLMKHLPKILSGQIMAKIRNASSSINVIVINNHYPENRTVPKTDAEKFNEMKNSTEYQKQALLYIIVVLTFYSISIVALMIKYVRQGSRHVQEEQMYQDLIAHTKRLSMQQQKADFARRVSFQLMQLAHIGSSIPRTATDPSTSTNRMSLDVVEDSFGIENSGREGIGSRSSVVLMNPNPNMMATIAEATTDTDCDHEETTPLMERSPEVAGSNTTTGNSLSLPVSGRRPSKVTEL